jgi:transposase
VARGANAIVLLDQGWSCERVAAALLLDDDSVRHWYRAYERGGMARLRSFGHEGSRGRLSSERERALSEWVDAHCPQHPQNRGAFLKRTFGVSYSRSGLIALLHRLESTLSSGLCCSVVSSSVSTLSLDPCRCAESVTKLI